MSEQRHSEAELYVAALILRVAELPDPLDTAAVQRAHQIALAVVYDRRRRLETETVGAVE